MKKFKLQRVLKIRNCYQKSYFFDNYLKNIFMKVMCKFQVDQSRRFGEVFLPDPQNSFA